MTGSPSKPDAGVAPAEELAALPEAAPFFTLLHQRRSVRAFDSRPLEEEQLRHILAAANRAPSAGNLQAYEIVVVRDASTRQALVASVFNQLFIAQAPVHLIFCANPERSMVKYGQAGGEFFALQDATIACAYAELAVAALGLGTVWIGALNAEGIRQAAKIPPGWKPVGLLPVGYRRETPALTPRRSLADLVHGLS